MVDNMVSAVVSLFGEYVPLNGEGLASINFPWLVGAVLGVLFIWFLMKLVLILIKGAGRG